MAKIARFQPLLPTIRLLTCLPLIRIHNIMSRFLFRNAIVSALLLCSIGTITPAAAYSGIGGPGYQFLAAVREGDGTKVTDLLGQTNAIINTRDSSTGDTALHICVEQRDVTWLRFLLGRGADANLVNRADVTPLLAAAQIGFVEGVQALVVGGARVNQSNRRGETALHLAVQRRDIAMVRALVAAGANADLTDSVTGNSARDYARADPRATAILAALDQRTAPTATTGITLQPAGPN
jgi:ankyrin repeat protein